MKEKDKVKKESVFKKLSPYLGRKKGFLPIAVGLSGLSAIANMVAFYYVWRICKAIFTDGLKISNNEVTDNAWMLFTFAVIGILIYFAALMFSHFAAFEIEINLKKTGFKKIMGMPLGFFNTASSGKIRKIVNDGASNTHTFLAHQLPDLAGSIVTPIMVLIFLFIFDWRLGLASLFPILASFAIMSKMMNVSGKELQKQYMDSLEEMSSEAVEYVRAIPVVKTFGQSVKSFTRFYNSINNYKDLVLGYTKLWTTPYSFYLILVESTALVLIPIAILLINNDANMGDIISNVILYVIIAPQLSMVFMRSAYFSQQKNIAIQSIDRFNNLFNYVDMQYPEVGAKFIGQDIEFKNVTFSYDGEKEVLKNINLNIKKGETLALVGPSGSGKTTIARLACRFWDVTGGEILIGGKNIKEYSKEELMDNISFVFQNNQLFKTSIRDNIIFGNENITEAKIKEALLRSRSNDIIDSLSDGIDTQIGKKGTYLSGGEQQRIALARSFIKDAPIVILDEATAFADPENEHLIQSALKELSSGKTTIMIAHRMTTVRDVDNIAVIEKGEIVEYGSHEELIEKNGIYRKMWDEYQSSVDWNIKKGAK